MTISATGMSVRTGQRPWRCPTVVEIVGHRKLFPPAAASSSGTAMTTPIALQTR